MNEYKSNGSEFYRNTRKRVIYEISTLFLVAIFFWTDFSDLIPSWLKISVLVVFSIYIIFGLALYPKAKATAKNFSVSLQDDALLFPTGNGSGRIPYSDLTIMGTKSKDDEVTRILLRTSFGQKIELQGLNNMHDLYKGLISHGVKET